MKYLLSILFVAIGLQFSIGQETISFDESAALPVPVITFEQQTIDIGDVKRGDKKDLVFKFTNTGTDFLQIDLVTSCNCTEIDYPLGPVAPGGSGTFKVTYDSAKQDLGQITKTIDIIANTDPIVVEAFFTVNVVE